MIVAGSIVIAALIAGIVLTFTQRGPTSSVLEGPAALPAGPALPSDQMVMTMVDDKNADLWVVKRGETTAARVRPLTSSPVADEFANLSPDRRTVIYRQSDTSNGTTVLRVVATNGTGDRPLFSDDPINCLSGIIRHAWNTADPTQLAVTCSKESGSAAYLVRTDGQIIRPLQLTDRDFGDPTFSPDGTRLAFWSANDFVAPGDPNGGIISVLNLADGEIRIKSSPSDAVDGDLAWSPTGELLAFTRYGLSGGADVVTINPDSGQIKSQTTSSALEALPSFSPNGRQIAYRSEERRESLPRGAGAKLWLLDLDTGNQDPMWQPTNLMNKYRHGRPAWTTR